MPPITSDQLLYRQNCSLSLKIEELNAHISTLYVENLRLRASEIALQAELKREKLKCHKIMSDAEAAVSPPFPVQLSPIRRLLFLLSCFDQLCVMKLIPNYQTMNLLKHFGIIRSSYNVSAEHPRSPKNGSDNDSPPTSARLQKPPPRSPSTLRLAALPSVPDITEEHEQESSPEPEEAEYYRSVEKLRSTRRKSPSLLPLPSRVSSPPPTPTLISNSGDEGLGRKRKLMRRPSGLMTTPEPIGRPISPILGSPMEDVVNLSAEEEAAALQDVEEIVAREEELEREAALRKARRRERARSRDEEEFSVMADQKEKKEKKKTLKDRADDSSTRLRDVTNSPRRKRSPNTDSASEGASSLHRVSQSSGPGLPSLSSLLVS